MTSVIKDNNYNKDLLNIKNDRLIQIKETIKKYVSDCTICDIGTDHGYLPMMLISENIALKAFACDKNAMPLQKAMENIKKFGYEDKVIPILSDGLKDINLKNEIDTIVIAGMGGELIINILLGVEWTKNKNLTFFLQPMSKIEDFRKELYLNGFNIEDEIPISDSNRNYVIMIVKYTGHKIKVNEIFSYTGKIANNKDEKSSEEIYKYYIKLNKKLCKQIDGLNNTDIKNTEKINELKEYSKIINEYFIEFIPER